MFGERVPLPDAARERIALSDASDFGKLAEGVEAWGFRLGHREASSPTARKIARRWFAEEYEPVVAILREAELIGRRETETDANLRLSNDRYRLMRTHAWSDEAIERVRGGR